MRIEKDLSNVVRTSKSDIRAIKEFASEIQETFLTVKNKNMMGLLSPEDSDKLKKFGEWLLGTLDDPKSVGKKEYSLSLSDKGTEVFIRDMLLPVKRRKFLAEMSLSYLISYQEAFIKNYLFVILLYKRQLLKTGSTITYEEIARHSSINSLWTEVAQKEVDVLGYGSIDDIAAFFMKKMNIDLTAFTKWEALRENNYRRNLIVHNQGLPNSIYKSKLNGHQRFEHLETDMDYVSAAVTTLETFIDFVHAEICKKFRFRNLTANSIGASNAKVGAKRRA